MDRGSVAGEADLFALGGDPDAIRASGGGWSAFGLRAEAAAVAVRVVAAVASADFVADEGVLFAQRLRGELAAGLTNVSDAWQQVGRALTVNAGELADCQAELTRLGVRASSEQSVVSTRSATLGRARAADAAHAEVLARPPYIGGAVAVRPVVPVAWTSGTPAATAALVEAQGALTAARQRAIEVRARHDRAVAVCCRAIEAAKALAPAVAPGVRGSAGGRYVLASVGVGSPVVSIRRGLTVASASSAVFADRVGVALRGARFAVAPDEPDGDDGGDGAGKLPSPERLTIIHDRLVGACMFEYSESLDPGELGDQHAACLGFADSAVSDPQRLAAALQMYPQAGDPTPQQQSAWSAIAEGFGLFAKTMATIAGVGDCLKGDAAGCVLGGVGILPLGRLARLGAGAADAAPGAERLAEAAVNGAEDADPAPEAPAAPETEVSYRLQVGYDREVKVAKVTNGRVTSSGPGQTGMMINVPGIGDTDVDVVGGDGSYIAVGGPAKAHKMERTAEKLTILRKVAESHGVRAQAYFTSNTPQVMIDRAEQVLGPGNVHTFD